MRTLDSAAPAAARPERDLEGFLLAARARLRTLLARQRIPPDDAEDLLQQTLLALVYQWDRVRDPEAWLVGTVRNQCRSYWRRKRRALYEAFDAAVLERLAAQAAAQERRDLLHDLEVSLDRLPPRCRCLLRLRYQLGYEPREVAERLGYSPLSIGKITQRCLGRLARELAAAADGADRSEQD